MTHLLRNNLGQASKRHRPETAVSLGPVYEAPAPQAADKAFEELAQKRAGPARR